MIETARKSKNLSQGDVGAAIEVSQSYVSRLERGEVHNLDCMKIVKLAEYLDLCPFELFGFITKVTPELNFKCYYFSKTK